MSCKHRFYNKLIPALEDLKYIFIGKFNPSWDSGDNNAEYFYGRSTNNFWCIMPHAFGDPCLINETVKNWENYCKIKKICITDLIKEISNVSENKKEDKDLITKGYSDSNLDKCDLIFNINEINNLITNNSNTLEGVFFTSKSKSGILNIWSKWQEVKEHCKSNNIYTNELVTPSPYGPGIRKTIEEWATVIHRKQ